MGDDTRTCPTKELDCGAGAKHAMPLHTLALPDPPPAPDTPPEPDTPPPRPVGALGAEGVLQNALVQLWEQARAKRVDMIGTQSLRPVWPSQIPN